VDQKSYIYASVWLAARDDFFVRCPVEGKRAHFRVKQGRINSSSILKMFTLPNPKKKSIAKWHGQQVARKGPLEGFVVVYPAEGCSEKMTKMLMKPKNTFILKHGGTFKYAYNDGFFKEIPERWYGKAFLRVDDVPSENLVTITLNGKFIEVPFLPDVLYLRKTTTKRRKKTHKIINNVYPTWRNTSGKTVHFKVAQHFKDLFDKADAQELTLQDPFSGYSSMEDLQSSQTGRLAFKTVAGFVYYHCRDNLGYPLTR